MEEQKPDVQGLADERLRVYTYGPKVRAELDTVIL